MYVYIYVYIYIYKRSLAPRSADRARRLLGLGELVRDTIIIIIINHFLLCLLLILWSRLLGDSSAIFCSVGANRIIRIVYNSLAMYNIIDYRII